METNTNYQAPNGGMAGGYYGMNQIPYNVYYDPSMMFNYPAYNMNQQPVIPMNSRNAINHEEVAQLNNTAPNAFDTSITTEENIASMCTHIYDNGKPAYVPIGDGTGDVYCHICKQRFPGTAGSIEELKNCTDYIHNMWETIKMTQLMPINFVRQYGPVVQVITKLPKAMEFVLNQVNKYAGHGNIDYTNDASAYAMYNSLSHNGMGMGYNGMPMNGYYGVPQQPYGQPMPNQQPYMGGQPINGYTPSTNPQAANPMNNPMQAPTYGVNPMAPNQQFVQQADMMMGGSVYGQNPYMPQQQPVFGNPNMPMNNQQPNMGQPQQQNNADEKVIPQGDGTVKKTDKISL